MTSSPLLPQLGGNTNVDGGKNDSSQDVSPTQVYSLTVLVSTDKGDRVSARAANLVLPEIKAPTIREALSKMVHCAKATINGQLNLSADIPWIDPPQEPNESESRFVVPLHL